MCCLSKKRSRHKVGKVKYFLSGKEIGSIDIVAAESVDEISYKSAMGDTVKKFLL